MDDVCVCCGNYTPEGEITCPSCRRKYIFDFITEQLEMPKENNRKIKAVSFKYCLRKST